MIPAGGGVANRLVFDISRDLGCDA